LTKIYTFIEVETNRQQSRPNRRQCCRFGRLFAYPWARTNLATSFR